MKAFIYKIQFLALLILVCSQALATDLEFSGPGNFSINGSQITINANNLTNVGNNRSGTLFLKLWAMRSNNPFGTGYVLAEGNLSTFLGSTQFGTLEPGQSYTNIRFTTSFSQPPEGTYYLFLHVSEFPNENTSLAYTEAVGNPFTFSNNGGNGGNGGTGGGTGGGSGSGGNTGGGTGGNQDLDLECRCSYTVDGDQVRIQVDRISNNRNGGRSGTLKLKLWATSTPYSGGAISGYTVAEIRLEQLQGGFFFSGIDQTTSFTRPPAGTYYFTLTLTEFNDGQDFIVDYSAFSGTETITGGGNGGNGGNGGGTGSGSGSGVLSLECPCTINYSGNNITLDVARVNNSRSGGSSGTLKLKIWATTTPYSGGSISGHTLAEFNLGQLDGGFLFQDISRTATLRRPPDGTYYITATLTEFDGQDLIVDSVNFDRQRTFTSPNTGGSNLGGGFTGGGNDETGGGSMSWFIPLLALITIYRIRNNYRVRCRG